MDNKIVLTDEQQFIVDKAVDWFRNSSEQVFSYTGGAGTGKSVVLNEILNRLHLTTDTILPMAYTGQAAIIMRKKGIPNACTCHSALFDPIQEPLIKDGKVVMDEQFNIPVTTWKFIPKDFTSSPIRLIIIDEGWMVPKRFRKFIDNTGIKVLVTGDSNQLPPIADDPAYLTDGKIYRLTKLMRQAENSPIVYLANRAICGMPIEPGLYGNSVFVIYDDELTDSILANSNIVLCAKNATREYVNNRIRNNILGFHNDCPNIGERLICRKNNWNLVVNGIPLVNGLVGTMASQPDVSKFNGQTIKIDFRPDLFFDVFKDIQINYKYLNANYRDKETIKSLPYEKGEKFEYAYGSTVHLSQGSEYNNGTFIEEYIAGDLNLQRNLIYTAITRFKNSMVYVKHRPKYFF